MSFYDEVPDINPVPDASTSVREAVQHRPGMLDRLIYRVFARDLTVVAVETLAGHFRLVMFQDDSLKGFDWIPGQKLQVAMGSALEARTYTPIEVDARSGKLRIIAYAHGSGPGSMWVKGLKPGDVCKAFGPSNSQDLRPSSTAMVLVGDETSIGLSCAAAAHRQSQGDRVLPIQHFFEVDSKEQVQALLNRLPDLGTVQLYEREPDNVHWDVMEHAIQSFVSDQAANIVLTGRASSIQRFRRVLRPLKFPGKQLSSKAFWADGKRGLD
ncbi:siderophore-interacting protein [Paracidovorax anthurii]|uniref:NADPH-dependent ferric siderophore reductase n=1 Tax=Paracidovorax anthurii TaxID=78229 RepID=A0A328ZWI2_9BURK|nr:siderophore-interacting protein [Paracidovorax anthurii]RAR86596.1 NADPH-dependent ferric siderophore reductase [Paracidovorax anthurii]